MIASIGKYECRLAITDDFDSIYEILVDKVCKRYKTENSADRYNCECRKLEKNIRFYLKTGKIVVVEDSDEMVSCCLIKKNQILHIGSKISSVQAVFCLIYVSCFIVSSDNTYYTMLADNDFSNLSNGKINIVRHVNDKTYMVDYSKKRFAENMFIGLGGKVDNE